MRILTFLLMLFSVISGCTGDYSINDGRLGKKAENDKNNVLLLASFNTLRLGEKEKNYKTMAEIISRFDLTALQEVMHEKGLKKLKGYLEKLTREKWEYVISESSAGSEGYREYYGFIYRKNKVQEVRKIGFYKEKNENEFMREPYGVYFKSENFDFVYISVHSIFGDQEKQRLLEASTYLTVYEYFYNLTGEDDIIIAGDFNVPADNMAFKNLHKKNILYLIEPGTNPTTISSGGPVSSYDNFFINKDRTKEYSGKSGVYNFVKDNNYDIIKKYISDHLPVFSEYYNNEDLD